MKNALVLIFLLPIIAHAQQTQLYAEGVTPDLYINHKVDVKENFYSIGRIYNISPKEIAPYNKLQLESGLSIGQRIKIPLNSNNFFQDGKAEADEIFVPVYYIIKEKEGLYRVGINHNNLPVETLKQWNRITGDAVKSGTALIIGYLKVKKELSPLAKFGIGTVIDGKTVAKAGNEKEDKPNKKLTAGEAGPPVVSEDKYPIVKNPDQGKNEKINPKTEDQVLAPFKNEQKAPEKNVTVQKAKPDDAAKNTTGGAFAILYNAQLQNAQVADEAGNAGIFKSTSGWSDKRYYCLHNKAAAGTVIKVTNPLNGKFIFAKVLDLIPDLKQNEGLLVLISNAAADALGAAEGNFNCTINYPLN